MLKLTNKERKYYQKKLLLTRTDIHNILKNKSYNQQTGGGIFSTLMGSLMTNIRTEVIHRIRIGKTDPVLETEEEKKKAIELFNKSWKVLEHYVKKEFWKKLEKSGILRRFKIKGISGIGLSLLSIIPGAGPLIAAPIKAFVLAKNTADDFQSRFGGQIALAKKAKGVMDGKEDLLNVMQKAENLIQKEIEIDRQEQALKNMVGGVRKTKKHKQKTKKYNKRNKKSRVKI